MNELNKDGEIKLGFQSFITQQKTQFQEDVLNKDGEIKLGFQSFTQQRHNSKRMNLTKMEK